MIATPSPDRHPPRVWFYRPELYWYGWKTLLPIGRGHDEYAHWVLILGWSFAGRVLIALWGCDDPECEAECEETRRWLAADAEGEAT